MAQALPGATAYAVALLRVMTGFVFVAHGYPKIGSLQGFAGFVGSLGVPLPQVAAGIVTAVEVGGGLALIVGLGARWAGFILAVEMLLTTVLVKLPMVGFVAPPDRPGVGAEIDLMLLAASLVIWAAGPGAWAIEDRLRRRTG